MDSYSINDENDDSINLNDYHKRTIKKINEMGEHDLRNSFDNLNKSDQVLNTDNAFDNDPNEPAFFKPNIQEGANKIRSQTV